MKATFYKPNWNNQRCLKLLDLLKKPAWLLLLMVLFNIKPAWAQYCTPTHSTYSVCAGGSINNVTFLSINNSPACAFGSSGVYYKDFTSTIPPVTVLPGVSYPISLSIGQNWAGGCTVWIDYDQNGTFDAGEVAFVGPSSPSAPFVFSGTVTIPGTASAGLTRMRVMGQEGGAPTNPCAGGYSEIHDYAVSIGGFPDNAGINALTEPQPGTFCSGSTVDAKVNVVNAGNNLISNVTIEWELDGTPQAPVSWSTPIDTFGSVDGNSAIVTLGSITFTSGSSHTIKAWTSMPNGIVDTFNNNDTITATIKPALSGTFTIGASGADYTSIAAAAADLSTVGVCGPVVFDVQAGTYTGAVVLNREISGSSAINTITFKGADSSSTIVTSSGSATFTLTGTNHVTLRDMKIQNTGSGSAIWLTHFNGDGADSNSIIHCAISCPVSSSGGYGIIASASSSGQSANNNANYTLVDSCTITGGNYGVLFYGDDQNVNVSNTVRNSFVSYNYSVGIGSQYQSDFKVQKNTVAYTGNNVNTFPTSISLSNNLLIGSVVEKNNVYGAIGGFGILTMNNNSTPDLVANNMISVGSGINTSMGMRTYSRNSDIVHNTIDIRSTDANSTAYNLIPAGTYTYNILNNIFRNANAGQAINLNTATGASIKLDNNCYFSLGNFPYRCNNANQTTLADFIGAANIFNDSFSIEANPVFLSSTDLRSHDFLLDGNGRPFPLVNTDIDDNVRDLVRPDIGVSEFTLPPRSDAGVIAILTPTQPVTPGLTDIKVVIKNFGIGDLTSVDITYESGATLFTQTYSGILIQGKTDTVTFSSSSGPGIDQQFNIPTTAFNIKAWTSNPNLEADTDTENDTISRSYCQPLNGAYTINAAGSGATNFTSLTAAVDAMGCGGVSGPVVFNIASGTYTEQIVIPAIAGISEDHSVTFTSSTGNRADVTITYAPGADSNNYVVAFQATQYITFKNLTLTNTSTTHSRVFAYLNRAGKGNEHITVTRCAVSGPAATAASNTTALFYGIDRNTDINITNNSITNGSYGVMLGGWTVVNQYSKDARIDSNIFTNNYSTAVYLFSREGVSIQGNTITNSDPFAGKYGIMTASTAGNVVISRNKIEMFAGTGIYSYNYAYYSEQGRATLMNNTIVLNGTGDISQNGIRLVGTSKTDILNNSVKLSSSKTSTNIYSSSNFGLFVEGDITYGNLGNATSHNVKVVNNIFYNENGYPVYFAEKAFSTGGRVSANSIAVIDHNLYFNNSGTSVAYVYGNTPADYPKASFSAYKRAVYFMADVNSIYAQPAFISATDLTPDNSVPAAWYLNGRGVQLTEVTEDFNGAERSTTIQTGPTDLGAIEFTPVSLPPVATPFPATPVAGGTQSFLFLGDTVAKITWDAFADVPASVEVSQYVGEIPPHASMASDYMYAYVSVKMPAAPTAYLYTGDMFYKDIWLGTIPSESGMGLIHHTDANGWDQFSSIFLSSTTDDLNNIISAVGFTDSVFLMSGTNKSAPLPVQLLGLTASASNNDAVLSWITASESNSSHFEVQRSVRKDVWEKAGTVKAGGNTTSKSSYGFTDRGVLANNTQTIYYRLKMTDHDGSYSYSNLASVSPRKNNTVTADLVYPNPFSDVLFITVEADEPATVTIELSDITGKKVISRSYNSIQGTNGIRFSTDNVLNTGVYFLSIEKNGVRNVQKLIKQ
jgi:hypothetical protein